MEHLSKDDFVDWQRSPVTQSYMVSVRRRIEDAKETTPCRVGYSLVTNSGSFCITTLEGTSYAVRDFTEVGWLHLEETYESTRSHLATLLAHRSQ